MVNMKPDPAADRLVNRQVNTRSITMYIFKMNFVLTQFFFRWRQNTNANALLHADVTTLVIASVISYHFYR